MKSLTYAAFATSLLLPTGAGLALPVKTVPSNNLQGMVIKVWAGHDLSMDFIGSGEVVTNAVIGNPSIVLGGLGGTLCPRISTSEQECNNTGAPAIYLRQTKIDPQSSYLLPSADGKTSLILTTSGPKGIKNYILTILPARGNPEYAGLEIKSPVVLESPQILPPALPRRVPIVQVPEPTSDTANAPQWQAKTPSPASQANNAPSFVTPAVTGVTPPVDSQQVTPNQNTVTSTPIVIATPQSVPKGSSSVPAERPSQNALSPYNPPLSDNSFTSASQQQTLTNPNPTSIKPSNNLLTSSGTNVNGVKIPLRTTLSPTVASNIISSSANNSIEEANALVRGLVIARQKGQINHGTTTWKEVQSVVRLLRRGDTKQKAAQEVGISPQLIDQLIIWGQRSTVANS